MDEQTGALDTTSSGSNPPAPVLAGTFAVYTAPDGGYVLVTDVAGRGVESKHIPGQLVRLVTSGKGAGRMFGKLFGSGEG